MSINDLFPGELLLELFRLAVNDPTVIRFWDDPVHPPLRTMLYITHVCRRWRSIALENSTLWKGCIDMGRPIECTMDILRRSRTQPLHLSFFVPSRRKYDPLTPFPTYRPAPDILENPFREFILSRTRSLHAILPSLSCERAFSYFKPRLWQMETISLELDTWYTILRSDGLFDEKKWMVRFFSLKRCYLRLQPKVLPFLEELRIEYPSAHAFIDLDTWLDLLAGLPQLRVFELVECFSASGPARTSRDKKVHMPKLEKLVLKTSEQFQEMCAPLLDALIIPPACALTLGLPILVSKFAYKALLSALSTRYNAYDNSLGDHLDLTIAGNAFAMQTRGASAPAETFIYFYFTGGCRHHACEIVDCPVTNAGLVFQTVLEAFRKPVSSIRWLTVRTYVHEDKTINPFFNLRLLRKFTDLQSIQLNVESIFGGFPPMDSESTFSTHPSDPRMFWFPDAAHRELVISKVDFDDETSLHNLCLALMRHLKPRGKRWNLESRIKTLSFRECLGLREWQLAKVEEMIGINYGVRIKCVRCEVLDIF